MSSQPSFRTIGREGLLETHGRQPHHGRQDPVCESRNHVGLVQQRWNAGKCRLQHNRAGNVTADPNDNTRSEPVEQLCGFKGASRKAGGIQKPLPPGDAFQTGGIDLLQPIASARNDMRFKPPACAQKYYLVAYASRVRGFRPPAQFIGHCQRRENVATGPPRCHEDAYLAARH